MNCSKLLVRRRQESINDKMNEGYSNLINRVSVPSGEAK